MTKLCEICEKEIPSDFVNLLCIDCYNRQLKEIEDRKKEEEEDKLKQETAIDEPSGKAAESVEKEPNEEKQSDIIVQDESKSVELNRDASFSKNGITDPDYQENPEAEDKNQVQANLSLFLKNGVLLWHPTRTIYEFIKNHCIKKAMSHPQYPKFIWKPTIVDVGCGCGVGSNVMSQEADFVWGIDKNEQSIKFAKEAFTRVKNGIYYNSQVSFDQFDIINETRETMKFDLVVAVETIEHISDHKKFLEQIIRFDKKDNNNPTEYFISTPNRNNKTIRKDRPYNKFHCREWRAEEFHAVLSEYFKNIEFFSSAGEPTSIDTLHTPILAKMILK